MPKYSKRRSHKSYKEKYSNRRRNTQKKKVRKKNRIKNRIKNYRGGAGGEGNLREHWRVGQAGDRVEKALKTHLERSVEIFPVGLFHEWSAWVPKGLAREHKDSVFNRYVKPYWIKPGAPVIYLNHEGNSWVMIRDGSLPHEEMKEME